MKQRKRAPKATAISTRRQFLQSSGAAGIALSSTLGSGAASAAPRSETNSRQCAFSGLPADFIYLNNGTEGSMPACVTTALQQAYKLWASNPTTSYEADPLLGKRQEQNRLKLAEFLGIGMNNICLTSNTTMGLSMALLGLNFRRGDRVVVSNHEHNAIKSPLRTLEARLGLQIQQRPFPDAAVLGNLSTDELLDALLPDSDELKGARALCVTHIYATTGVRLPLQALRRKADALDIQTIIIDGAHALGMIDLTTAADNIAHSDFYACPGHKWLNGPPGTGALYLRDEDIRPPEFYPTISQRMQNYLECETPEDACIPMAQALQVRGCSNAPGFLGMIRAIEFADNAGGAQEIERHILELSKQVKEFLLSRSPRCVVSPHSDPGLSSGLTVFFPFRWQEPSRLFADQHTVKKVVSELLKKNIQVRSIGFYDLEASGKPAKARYAIRVSTAYFNTASQVDVFNAALQEILTQI
jgi:selenocysteine lyase/cysteine desulfurase